MQFELFTFFKCVEMNVSISHTKISHIIQEENVPL